jgi:hypothetical protein
MNPDVVGVSLENPNVTQRVVPPLVPSNVQPERQPT